MGLTPAGAGILTGFELVDAVLPWRIFPERDS